MPNGTCVSEHSSSKLAGGKLVVLEVLAQLQLVDLACRCVGDLLHKYHIFWHPPLGNLALQHQDKLWAAFWELLQLVLSLLSRQP